MDVEPDWRLFFLFLVELAKALVCGRVLLSLLPPGRVGSHRAPDLGTTFAASLLLGFVTLRIPASLVPRGESAGTWITSGWVAVGALRWWLRPQAFVPQHETPRRAYGWTTLPVLAACAAPIVWGVVRDRDAHFGLVLNLVFVAQFVLHGLETSRRSPLGRAAVATLLVIALQGLEEATSRQLWIPAAAGAAFTIDWIRRADRRSLWLACIGFAVVSLSSWAVALAGAAVLVRATHRNARGAVLVAVAASAVAVALPLHASSGWTWPRGPDSDLMVAPIDAFGWATHWSLAWIPIAVAIVAALCGLAGGRMRESAGTSIAAPRREARALAAFVVVSLVLHALEERLPLVPAWSVVPGWPACLDLLLPAGALVFGLVFLPSERGEAAR